MTRYFIGFLIFVGLIVLAFVLLLGGGSKTPKPAATSITSYANSATVMRLTIDGPITAEQTHRSVQITVGRDQSTIDIIQGYQDTVLNHVGYANNSTSYTVFLHAINLANFTKTRVTKNTDDRGVCPQGDRYIFEIVNGATDLQRTWTSTCSGTGTFGGSTQTLLSLFQRQIPDYGKLTLNVDIGSTSF